MQLAQTVENKAAEEAGNTKIFRLHPAEILRDLELLTPGSKSETNRALIIAALANGSSRLRGISVCDDTLVLIAALSKLGVVIEQDEGELVVHGCGGELPAVKCNLELESSGTAARFLTALCSAMPGAEVTLKGSSSLSRRPIAGLVNALRSLGARIDYLEGEGTLPISIHGGRLAERQSVEVQADTSSQFISALLLIAPLLSKGLEVKPVGNVVSSAYLDLTAQCMKRFGIQLVRDQNRRIFIPSGQNYSARNYKIEGDLSSACYLWGIAAIAGQRISVTNVNLDSLQGEILFPMLLEQMGCEVEWLSGKDGGAIAVSRNQPLKAISADLSLLPDSIQTLAVVSAFAQGTTTIAGIRTLRHKETDRVQALEQELAKVAIECEVSHDSITIHGGVPEFARIRTYDDHRMAMAFSMFGALGQGIEIENPRVVTKSFPRFWDAVSQCGVEIS